MPLLMWEYTALLRLRIGEVYVIQEGMKPDHTGVLEGKPGGGPLGPISWRWSAVQRSPNEREHHFSLDNVAPPLNPVVDTGCLSSGELMESHPQGQGIRSPLGGLQGTSVALP